MGAFNVKTLTAGQSWTVTGCHWLSIYSDGITTVNGTTADTIAIPASIAWNSGARSSENWDTITIVATADCLVTYNQGSWTLN